MNCPIFDETFWTSYEGARALYHHAKSILRCQIFKIESQEPVDISTYSVNSLTINFLAFRISTGFSITLSFVDVDVDARPAGLFQSKIKLAFVSTAPPYSYAIFNKSKLSLANFKRSRMQTFCLEHLSFLKVSHNAANYRKLMEWEIVFYLRRPASLQLGRNFQGKCLYSSNGKIFRIQAQSTAKVVWFLSIRKQNKYCPSNSQS